MSKVDLTVFNEFKEAYYEDGSSDSRFFYELFCGDLDSFNLPCKWSATERLQLEDILAKYGYETLEGDYGGEGEGEYCYGVISFMGKYYKAEWTYYSYNGCEYDNIENTIKEVSPVERLVTFYEPV